MDAGFRAGFRDYKIIGEPAQTVPFAAVGPPGLKMTASCVIFVVAYFNPS